MANAAAAAAIGSTVEANFVTLIIIFSCNPAVSTLPA
jgi:hypothetical protein